MSGTEKETWKAGEEAWFILYNVPVQGVIGRVINGTCYPEKSGIPFYPFKTEELAIRAIAENNKEGIRGVIEQKKKEIATLEQLLEEYP